jgi:hypothetical protein
MPTDGIGALAPYYDVDRALAAFAVDPACDELRAIARGDNRFGLYLVTIDFELAGLLRTRLLRVPVSIEAWRGHFDAGDRPVIALQLEMAKLGVIVDVPPGTVIE